MLWILFRESRKEYKKNLSEEMEKASDDLDYEKAAILRDRIKAIYSNSIIPKNKTKPI